MTGNACFSRRIVIGGTDLGFPAGALLTTGEQAAGTLLGLEGDHTGGLLAKGDLCRYSIE